MCSLDAKLLIWAAFNGRIVWHVNSVLRLFKEMAQAEKTRWKDMVGSSLAGPYDTAWDCAACLVTVLPPLLNWDLVPNAWL